MTSEPSPLSRLLRLERAVEQLVAANLPDSIREIAKATPPSRAVWPADQLLLTRILRRSPQVLEAYQASGQILVSNEKGTQLSLSDTNSVFKLCQLIDGDAVLWLDQSPPDWVWHSDAVRSIYDFPDDASASSGLVLQELALFKPLVRGETWILHRRGEMVSQPKPFPEQAEQATLLRRLESLERQVVQLSIKTESTINELRSQLGAQQTLLDQLLQIFPNS